MGPVRPARSSIGLPHGRSSRRADTASNVPEYTVSEISGAVKRTLEGTFGRVRVRGEITELKRYPSGHIYFSLKDEGAKLVRRRLEIRRPPPRAWCRRTAWR